MQPQGQYRKYEVQLGTAQNHGVYAHSWCIRAWLREETCFKHAASSRGLRFCKLHGHSSCKQLTPSYCDCLAAAYLLIAWQWTNSLHADFCKVPPASSIYIEVPIAFVLLLDV